MNLPIRLEYRLTEADVHHYCSGGLVRKCWGCFRGRKVAILLLVALGVFLVGTCFRTHGTRAGGLALGTALIVLGALAWGRELCFERCVCRVAGQFGLPRDLRLVVSPEGITEESGPEIDDPSRTFAWSEPVALRRVERLTAIHLRPAGAVLIVPDSAFSSEESRDEFEEAALSWREAATSISEGVARRVSRE